MKKSLLVFFIIIQLLSCAENEETNVYHIADNNAASTIFIDSNSDALIQWAAEELSKDIERITGTKPDVLKTSSPKGEGIYIGELQNELIKNSDLNQDTLKEDWESFSFQKTAGNLVIAGSDVRGTVYGVFELAERLGISPWKWWADVTPLKKEKLQLEITAKGITQSPSVQYRGIFLNDEDWGLQPWAAKNFETETGDIGPKTYEKIFQLLLRLKANTIWPAMHPCTQGFFTVEGNKEMAKKYHMLVGTSHAEPMMRNNVSEWGHDKGEYNYVTNKESIQTYWQSRINEIEQNNISTIMTLGMRGIHDSGMKGISSKKEGAALLEDIITTQREMLSKTFKKTITEIPQVFIPYKEVLDMYDEGLKVPEDVTLMWTDDNYGYIRRLSNTDEQQRVGGSGVYYHLSYWGRPHDYLWLSTTQPGLIWSEMQKAYANGAKKIWIANVGDIKPGEYNMELFLDMAWDTNSIGPQDLNVHLKQWAAREFGAEVADEVKTVMDEYYRLASLRKPEYMGWSQTEPTTPTTSSEFSSKNAQRRIDAYTQLVKKVDSLSAYVSKERIAAWFQLVEYPVKGAALINHKFLYQQLAATDSSDKKKQEYLELSANAYQSINDLTTFYNTVLKKGKWNHMMSMSPRNLPVFDSLQNNTGTSKITTRTNHVFKRQYKKAADFNDSKGNWKTIKGLGYSNEAITLFPLQATQYKEDKPWVAYEFDVAEIGSYQLELRFIPTHANIFDHEITIEVDGRPLEPITINTKGRSPEWKENVLRNSKIVRKLVNFEAAGKHFVKVYVNQTGMVLDQLALSAADDINFYEIPNL